MCGTWLVAKSTIVLLRVQWDGSRVVYRGLHARLLSGLLFLVICGSAQTSPKPMILGQSRYEVRAGEPVTIAAQGETLDFLLKARTRRVSMAGLESSGLVVGPNHAGDRILLAASLRAKPGEHRVTLSRDRRPR